jgi:hypothetical protein
MRLHGLLALAELEIGFAVPGQPMNLGKTSDKAALEAFAILEQYGSHESESASRQLA